MADQTWGQSTNNGTDGHNLMVVNDDGSINSKQAAGDVADIVIRDPDTGDGAKVNDDGQLHIVAEGHLCTLNSTETPLAADVVWTGEAVNILAYNAISVFCTSDQDSATDGLEVQFSKDGSTNWRTAESYTVLANAEKFFSPPSFGVYMRVKYTNGDTDQTSFELTTVLRKVPFKWSSHNIETPITDQDDAELVKSVITGKKANGDYDNVSLTNGGNIKASLEELESGISSNSNSQLNVTQFQADGKEGALITGVKKLSGNDGIDSSTNSLQVMQYEHHEIHAKSHFNYCDYELNKASGYIINFVMTAPDTLQEPHLTFELYASEGATLELYEGTVHSGGTAITPRNNNRRTPLGVSSITLVRDPTITSDGTRAAGFLAGGGKTAGFTTRDKENILGQATSYLVRITSLAVSNDISWCAEWYEHTPKN